MKGLLTFGILYVAVAGDRVLEMVSNPVLRAAIDSSTHGLIGLLSWSVVLSGRRRSECLSGSKRLESLLCFLVSTALDLDHFVSARSFSIRSALQLGDRRPILHCTSLWFALFAACLAFSKVVGGGREEVGRVGWVTWVGAASHQVRDGSRRGLWLWPLPSTPPLPYPLYLALVLALPHLASLALTPSASPSAPSLPRLDSPCVFRV